MAEYEIIQINENTWRIENTMVRCFLLEGENIALLIDTGMTLPNAKEIAESITGKPLKLLNTHTDGDHISGNAAFDEIYMGKNEPAYYSGKDTSAKLNLLSDGDELDLGGRKLRIYDLAGHTPGSIAVLDINARVLISGDSIQDGNIFMMGQGRDLDKYIETLTKLLSEHKDEFDLVYPSHGTIPVKPDIIPTLIKGAEDIRARKISGNAVDFMGNKFMRYDVGCAGFLRDGE